MLWPKKSSYKEFDNEKKFMRLENSPPSPPPHNFSNGPSLSCSFGSTNNNCAHRYSQTVYTEGLQRLRRR